jgi:hypothetical protein
MKWAKKTSNWLCKESRIPWGRVSSGGEATTPLTQHRPQIIKLLRLISCHKSKRAPAWCPHCRQPRRTSTTKLTLSARRSQSRAGSRSYNSNNSRGPGLRPLSTECRSNVFPRRIHWAEGRKMGKRMNRNLRNWWQSLLSIKFLTRHSRQSHQR